MNGLDPAGMQDMREMILSLVAEGRTVMLSSHLLDEVERTCDAVAIVDHGQIIRQGPISELLAGSSVVVRGRTVPTRTRAAAALLAGTGRVGTQVQTSAPNGLAVSLPEPARAAAATAEIGRLLVEGGTSRLPAAARPGVARSMVLAGHQPTRGGAMTTVSDVGAHAPGPIPAAGLATSRRHHRGFSS